MEQMKTEANKYSFNPTMTTMGNNSRMEHSMFNRSNLMDKTNLYHQDKEEKREMLRNKHQKKEEEFLFRPRINSQSKNLNRNINDLYQWKNKVDEGKEDKIRYNDAELDMNKEKDYMPNATSMMIVKKNNYYNFKKNSNKSQDDNSDNENNDEVEFDLWPDIEKTYINKGENDTITDNNNNNLNEDLSNY